MNNTLKEAIEILNKLLKEDWCVGYDLNTESMLQLENCRQEASHFLDTQENTLNNNNNWISVDTQLPPMNVKFDVWDNYHKKRLADHGAFTGIWDDGFRKDTLLIKGYTHWMPIPKGPAL